MRRRTILAMTADWVCMNWYYRSGIAFPIRKFARWSVSLRRKHGLWFGLILLGAIVGCGEKTGTISGNVSYNGEPVQMGAIAFLPADGNGPASGSEITNGAYRVTEVQPGPKIVKIEAVKQVQFAQNTEDLAQAAKAGTAPELADLVPVNAVGNNEKVTVTAGNQTRDFKLAKPKE